MPSKPSPAQAPSFITSVTAVATRCLATRLPGVDGAEARGFVSMLVRELRQQWGGRSVYVPAGHNQQRAERDEAIRRDFAKPGPGGVAAGSAARAVQLAKAHGLTERRVRSIVKALS